MKLILFRPLLSSLVCTAFVCAAITSLPVNAQSGPEPAPVSIYVYPILLPVSSSSAFMSAATNTVMQTYVSGTPLGTLGHKLVPSYIAQSVDSYTNWTLWFLVDIRGRDSSVFFSPTNLSFNFWSSDYVTNADLLGTTRVYNNPNTNYTMTPSAMGVLYGSGGPGVNDNLVAQGGWNQMVNRFIFIGASGNAFGYNDASGMGNISSYMQSFTNYLVTGTWSLMPPGPGSSGGIGYAGNPVTAHVTLQMTDQPIRPVLDIRLQDGEVNVGIDVSTNQTAILRFFPNLPFGSEGETVIGTWNAGDAPFAFLPTDPSSGNQGYFDAIIE